MIFINFVEIDTGNTIGFSMGSAGKPVNFDDVVTDVNGDTFVVVNIESEGITNNVEHVTVWVRPV